MKIHQERNRCNRINYEKIADNTLELINVAKSKKKSVNIILKEVREYLTSFLVMKSTDYDKCISKQVIRMLEKYDMTEEKSLLYIESILKYNSELTYKNQVLNAFTFLEVYFNPGKFDDYALNIKELTSKKK